MRAKKVSGVIAGAGFLGMALVAAACGTSGVVAEPADSASTSPQPTGTTSVPATPAADAQPPPPPSRDGAPPPDGATPSDASPDAPPDAPDAAPDGPIVADAGPDVVVEAGSDASPPVAPAVRFVGRWDTRSAAGPRVAYPGARIIARFDGTEASVTMGNTTGFSGGPSRYDVFVDDVLDPTQLVTVVGTRTYPLATGLAAGVHKVELVKRTEGNLGVTTFMGFDFGADGTLLAPPPESTRRIEFISDSTIDGFGVEGTGPVCPAGTLEASHSARGGFAGLTAKDVGADAIQVAYSGKGLFQNSFRPDTATMGVLYRRALPDDASSLWNHASFVPDVVVISIGGTDYSASDGPPPIAQVTAKYDELVTAVRTNAPNAYIYMVIFAQIKDVFPAGYNARTNMRTIINTVIANHAADTKLYLHEMTESVPSQETGCSYHANPALHRSLTNTFLPILRAQTGW